MISGKITKLISAVVVFAGITVILGWILNIPFLKSISPAWVSMKFDTAIAFVLSGIILYFIVRATEGEFDRVQVVLSVASLILILLMGVVFFSILLGIRTGIEDLFIKDSTDPVKTVVPGRPSLPTVLNFILIALASVLTMLNVRRLQFKLRVIGMITASVGAIAITGYIINFPLLYFFLKGLNSAMACHTAVLFVLLGIGLICLSD